MALRAEYSLGHSELNDFLFAVIGEEENGAELTVLSAFSRLGLDPWKEAARLSELPKQAATDVLMGLIADFPSGDGKISESLKIASRLVKLLPESGSRFARPAAGEGIEHQDAESDARKYLVWFIMAAVIVVVVAHLFGV